MFVYTDLYSGLLNTFSIKYVTWDEMSSINYKLTTVYVKSETFQIKLGPK